MTNEQVLVKIRDELSHITGERRIKELRFKESDILDEEFKELEETIRNIRYNIETHQAIFPRSGRRDLFTLIQKVTEAINVCDRQLRLNRLKYIPRYDVFIEILKRFRDDIKEFRARLNHIELTGTVEQTRNWFIKEVEGPFTKGILALRKQIKEEDQELER